MFQQHDVSFIPSQFIITRPTLAGAGWWATNAKWQINKSLVRRQKWSISSQIRPGRVASATVDGADARKWKRKKDRNAFVSNGWVSFYIIVPNARRRGFFSFFFECVSVALRRLVQRHTTAVIRNSHSNDDWKMFSASKFPILDLCVNCARFGSCLAQRLLHAAASIWFYLLFIALDHSTAISVSESFKRRAKLRLNIKIC